MYQSIGYDKKNGIMHVWDDELGHQKFPFQPYGYLPNTTGQYQSLDGTRLDRVSGNHRDNPKSYESDLNEEVRTLIDLYLNQMSHQKDIEISSSILKQQKMKMVIVPLMMFVHQSHQLHIMTK